MTARPPFLFDLDGTLADTLGDLAASTNHVRAAFALPPLPPAAVRRLIGDGARTLLARALHERLAANGPEREHQLDQAFASYLEHHAAQCTATAQLYPGVRTFLTERRAAGHPLAVVTNKPERFALPLVAHLGLHDLLPVVIGGDTLPQKKPDPAPIRLALQRLGTPPELAAHAVMIGDGVQDLRAGKAAGLRTIGCLFGYGDPAALRAEGADAFWQAFGEPARD
ncbi:MAG: HAD-IA family hydrolase [Planctomycetes bacterium]|nr:HAD-IA family hydrolase [Planctomycetota bacterium]